MRKEIKILFFVSMLTTLVSCFKKSDEIPNMTTNFLDEDYNGGIWYDFIKYQKITPTDTLPFIRFIYRIKPEQNQSVGCLLNIEYEGTIKHVSTGNMFMDIYDLTPGMEHCCKIGVLDGTKVINEFESCNIYNE